MPSNRLTFGVLALACVVATGGGAYLVTRQARTAVPAPPEASQAAPAVTATEAVVEDVPNVPEQPSADAAAVQVAASAPAPPVAAPTRAPERAAPAPAPRRPRPAARVERPSRPEPPARAEAPPAEEPPVAETPVAFPAPVVVASPPPPPPPAPVFEELVVSADSVLGLQIDTAVSSEQAKVEDRVRGRVTRDVKIGDEVAIPAGSRVEGSVTLVEKGGKVKERARLGIRFHTLVLEDGARVPLSTEALFRDGESPTGQSTAKIGGAAVGGAILGAIFGGAKGATIGGAVGAGAGTAATLAGDRNPATFAAGSAVTVRILSPVTVTIEK